MYSAPYIIESTLPPGQTLRKLVEALARPASDISLYDLSLHLISWPLRLSSCRLLIKTEYVSSRITKPLGYLQCIHNRPCRLKATDVDSP